MKQNPTRDTRRVVIVGGGNAGVSIAARLRRRGVEDVVIIEPREEHVYAPLQSHTAGGVAVRRHVSRPQADVTPRGVTWVRDRVRQVLPDADTVELSSGERIPYGQLIIAAGIEHRWNHIPGLEQGLRSPSIVSNYTLPLANQASTVLAEVTSGTVVFTQAAEPASCAGVAQKPMYLACDRWRKSGRLDAIRVVFITPERTLFAIPAVASELSRNLTEYGIEAHYGTEVVAVRADEHELDIRQGGQTSTVRFDVLHAAPPHAAATWITASGLGDADGFVDVDPETLRHRGWGNIWALGDAAPVTPIRSGGAIRSQSQVIAKAHTPFTVTRRTAVFAEFDRAGALKPSIPFWKSLHRERRFTYVMDRWVLPLVYWNLILTGRA